MSVKISILGCGWMGLPLSESLVREGFQVKGSTTTREKLEEIREKGIEPYHIELNPALQCDDCDTFWDTDILILNIPPGRGRKDIISYHSEQIKSVINQVEQSPVKFVVFVSSTSVYPEIGGCVKERDAEPGKASRESGNALLKAEEMLLNAEGFETTVVRFGGLYGYDRHPVKYLEGGKELDRGNAPINLIHRDDCIRIIKQIIEEEITGEIFNAVSDGHPPRNVYYTAVAKVLGLNPPSFAPDNEHDYKAVSNRKLKEMLKYRFTYPNPMDFSEYKSPVIAGETS